MSPNQSDLGGGGGGDRPYYLLNLSLNTCMSGRVHAKLELRNIEQWKEASCDEWLSLGQKRQPNNKAGLPTLPPATPVCLSPNHFERKYGRAKGFSPRKQLQPLGLSLRPTPPPKGRAVLNAEARAACWRVAHLCAIADPAASSRRNAAAAAPAV